MQEFAYREKQQSVSRANNFPGTETGRRERGAKQTQRRGLLPGRKPRPSPPERMGRKTRPQDAQATVQSLPHVGSPWELLRATLKRKKLSDNELMYKLFSLL